MKADRAGTVTHDYKRHGTTTQFAALNTLDGSVISMCQPRRRHIEWLKFLRLIDRSIPKHLSLHLIADNYATHNHPEVKKAGPPPALRHALHVDERVLVEHGGTFLPRYHRETNSPGHLRQRGRTGTGD